MIYLQNTKTGLYFIDTESTDTSVVSVFTEYPEHAIEFISYQEARDVARGIEVSVEVVEE